MKSIQDKGTLDEVVNRINVLKGTEQRLWGTMTVSQMLAHCTKQLEMGTGAIPTRSMFPKPIQWLAKQTFGFKLPWSRNLPTAPEMVARKEVDFDNERTRLLETIDLFLKTESLGLHPIFGNMTKEEWCKIAYKHLDHHLRQFGK